MKWVQENSNEKIAEAIHPYFSDMSIEDLTSVVERYKSQDSWNESPMFTKESFDHLLEIIISAGILNEEDKVDYEILFDPSFSENLQ